MSERKFNRDLDDTEPVKFKPLYLIVGVCVVVIAALACIIYIYLNKQDETKPSNENNSSNTETINEPVEYVIPEAACTKKVTVSDYKTDVFNSCTTDNVVLNFTDLNMIIDTTKVDKNFKVNGIYFNKIEVPKDDYLSAGTFKNLALASNDSSIELLFTDASADKKTGLYVINNGDVTYSGGMDSNTVYTLGKPIKYTKYTTEGLNKLDCNLAKQDPKMQDTKLYEEGTVTYENGTYNEIFTKNVLVKDVCK